MVFWFVTIVLAVTMDASVLMVEAADKGIVVVNVTVLVLLLRADVAVEVIA